MEYEFFIDLFFFADLFFNFLSLSLTGILLRQRSSIWRRSFSAAVGSVWNCILILFPVLPRLAELFLTASLMSTLLIFLTFGFRTAGKLAKGSLSLLLAAAFVSGIMTFLRDTFWLTDGEMLALLGILCIGVTCFLGNIMREREIGTMRYQVRLYHHGICKEFAALADSGNRLRVPETGKPVSLIAYSDCIGFCDHVHAGFYIPYRAVGTETGLLFAMMLERMEIIKDGKTIVVENPVVAVSKERLSSDDSFSVLLPEEYIRQ